MAAGVKVSENTADQGEQAATLAPRKPVIASSAASSQPETVSSVDTRLTRRTSTKNATEPMDRVSTQQAGKSETWTSKRLSMRERQNTVQHAATVGRPLRYALGQDKEELQAQEEHSGMQRAALMNVDSNAAAQAAVLPQGAASQLEMTAKQHTSTMEKERLGEANRAAEQQSARKLVDVMLHNMLVLLRNGSC